MWTTARLTLSILFICGLEAAPLSSCPKSCICTGTEFYCQSFTFLPKLPQKLTKLVINNSTASTNPKLSNLLNLRTLNLASNKIKQLNSLYFPKSVELLDLSNNFITTLPHDLHSTLTKLKELRLSGNPISCTCDSVTIRDQLLQNNVIIPSPVKCHSPEHLRGKSWLTVSCGDGLFGEMQGDAPYEGSGFETTVTETDSEGNQDKSLEEEFIRVDSTTEPTKLEVSKSEDEDGEDDEEDGSGSDENITPLITIDDDSDDDTQEKRVATEDPIIRVNDLLLNNVKACNFDCSTPAPPTVDPDALPPPDVFEGVKIVWDDFNILKTTEPTATTTTTTESPSTPVPTESIKDIKNVKDAEILENQVAAEDKGNITENPKQSNFSTYIFLGALLLLIIALVVYAVIKKRSAKRRSLASNTMDEKPTTKDEIELLKATKPSNGTHESAPFINGHSNNKEAPYEDVELRKKPNESDAENSNLLVPEAKRVTIKASEIPNSTPKTPILVTRHLNSDGNIVTTPAVRD